MRCKETTHDQELRRQSHTDKSATSRGDPLPCGVVLKAAFQPEQEGGGVVVILFLRRRGLSGLLRLEGGRFERGIFVFFWGILGACVFSRGRGSSRAVLFLQ